MLLTEGEHTSLCTAMRDSQDQDTGKLTQYTAIYSELKNCCSLLRDSLIHICNCLSLMLMAYKSLIKKFHFFLFSGRNRIRNYHSGAWVGVGYHLLTENFCIQNFDFLKAYNKALRATDECKFKLWTLPTRRRNRPKTVRRRNIGCPFFRLLWSLKHKKGLI